MHRVPGSKPVARSRCPAGAASHRCTFPVRFPGQVSSWIRMTISCDQALMYIAASIDRVPLSPPHTGELRRHLAGCQRCTDVVLVTVLQDLADGWTEWRTLN